MSQASPFSPAGWFLSAPPVNTLSQCVISTYIVRNEKMQRFKTELKYEGLAVACCCLYQYPSPPQMSKSRSEGSKIWEHRCGLLASHILLDLFHSYHPKTNRRRRAVFLSDKGVLSYLMANETGKLGHATRLASKLEHGMNSAHVPTNMWPICSSWRGL